MLGYTLYVHTRFFLIILSHYNEKEFRHIACWSIKFHVNMVCCSRDKNELNYSPMVVVSFLFTHICYRSYPCLCDNCKKCTLKLLHS
jgi:hypothetical protein